jgi:regulator of protease activity HflC (stomatin/prohibitin superfamily)
MITLLFIITTVVVTGIYVARSVQRNQPNEPKLVRSEILTAVSILLVGMLIAFVQPFKLERVDAGHVGIKVNLTGNNRGVSKFEYKTGWVIYNIWIAKLYEFPTYQQSIEYTDQEVITRGGFPATIHPKFNYTLNSGNIGDMFQNLRLDVKSIEQGWLKNAIIGAMNDVANKWAVDDIFNKRERFEADIVVEANKRVSRWFNISQLRTNITPPQELVSSIIEKTKAIQEVQVAENNKQVAIAQGETRIATARADSASAVIAAAGEAEAIRRKQVTLNSTYIEYLKVNKWNGILPTVTSGSNGGLILQLPKQSE